MDELKKYMQQHLAELDSDEPRERVWQNIQQKTTPVKKANVIMMATRWAVAACVIALAGVGGWHLLNNKPAPADVAVVTLKQEAPKQDDNKIQASPVTTTPAEDKPEVAADKQYVASAEPVKPRATKLVPTHVAAQAPGLSANETTELENVESSFKQVINLQKERINTTPLSAENPGYFSDFTRQLRQMEKDEDGIKRDIHKNGLNDELLDQLINVYQQKLNVLKQLQTEMNKTNNRYKQNRGPVDSTKTYFLNI